MIWALVMLYPLCRIQGYTRKKVFQHQLLEYMFQLGVESLEHIASYFQSQLRLQKDTFVIVLNTNPGEAERSLAVHFYIRKPKQFCIKT